MPRGLLSRVAFERGWWWGCGRPFVPGAGATGAVAPARSARQRATVFRVPMAGATGAVAPARSARQRATVFRVLLAGATGAVAPARSARQRATVFRVQWRGLRGQTPPQGARGSARLSSACNGEARLRRRALQRGRSHISARRSPSAAPCAATRANPQCSEAKPACGAVRCNAGEAAAKRQRDAAPAPKVLAF